MSQEALLNELTEYDEETTLKMASDIASVNLLFAEQELGRRIVDTNLTTRALLDIAEHSYKVSGMQKKQEPKSVGERFSITINIPPLGGKPPETIVLESCDRGDVELPTPTQTPTALLTEASSLIDWSTTPEFS